METTEIRIEISGNRLHGYTLILYVPNACASAFHEKAHVLLSREPIGPNWGVLYEGTHRHKVVYCENRDVLEFNIKQIKTEIAILTACLQSPEELERLETFPLPTLE